MSFDGRLTVADLLSEESLRLQLVAGAPGVRSPISGVHISEMPDPTPWLGKGDLLLTTGLALVEDEDLQVQLVRRLKESGMSGIGVGVDIFMQESSAAMRAEADAQQLPLFEVPLEIPFKSITGLVFHSLYNADFYQLRRSLSVQDRLLALLLEDRGVDHLVSSVAMLLSTSVVVFDGAGRVVSQAYARAKVTPHLRELMWRCYLTNGCRQTTGVHGQEVGAHEVFYEEVRLGGRVELVLCFVYPKGEAVSEMGRVIAAYVAKLLALEVHRTRDEVLLQERMRAGLLDDILSGSGRDEDLLDRLKRFGFAPGRPLTLVLCDIAGFVSGIDGAAGLEVEESLQRLKILFKEVVDGFFSDRRVPFISLAKSDAVV
ncbi:MAG TPA: PucR family transcriptional regulator ligand-binding domain-containing protein, partial [Thermoleophilia bacterium]|nr:PucR family transcriptional regulator ligand-binding domain-containing protein [Thermoleophilia bacterium]